MNKSTLKGKDLLISILQENGWQRDQWGHFKKEIRFSNSSTQETTLRLCRIKLKSLSCRLEVQREIGGQNTWIKRANSYYKDLTLTADGRLNLSGLKIGRPKEVKLTGLAQFL